MDTDDLYEESELNKVYDRDLARRLMTYLRPYWKWVLGGILLIFIGEGARNVTPILSIRAIDGFTKEGLLDGLSLGGALYALRWIVFGYIAFLIVDLVSTFIRSYVMQLMGQYIVRDIRLEIFRHIHRLHLQYFDNTPVGRLMVRVMNDTGALNELFSSGIVETLGSIIGLTAIIVMMFVVNWKLALVTLAVLPIIGAATLVFQIVSRRAYREWRRQLSRLNAYMNERITGVTTVQLFNQEQSTFDKFADINRKYQNAALRGVLAMAFFAPLVEFAGGLATAVILWFGGGQVIQNHVSLGQLFAFLVWGQRFFWPLRDLSQQYNTLIMAMASSERIFQILNTEPAIPEKPDAKPLAGFEREVEFRDVWFAYKEEDYVLKGIDLTIEKGDRVAIVGATGSGKTTITNLLCRFYDIQKGSILIDGVDIRDLKIADLRQKIAIVQQDVFLFAGNILENIRLGDTSITEEDVRRAAEGVQANHFIEALPAAYHDEVKERGATFSVGQKQLISFARALAYDPEILILDEATSSIDTETELLIQEGLKRLLEGRTAIIIAHRLSTIQDADKIVVMHKGQIREVGTHAELLRQQGIYYRLYQLQYKNQEIAYRPARVSA